MNKAYHISINWSNAGNNFIADVPELSGCVADGRTFMEALENVKLLMEEWIQIAAMSGQPIPQPHGKIYYA